MASIAEVINSFDVKSKEFESLVHDLMVEHNDVPFDSQEVDTIQNIIVKSVNSRMNQAAYDGLLILDRVLSGCSKDVFSKYGLFWITNAIKILENVHSSTRDLTLACKVLGSLIEHCKEIPELHKQISMQNVKQLINALSALQTDAKCGAVYYLIAVLLYYYPEVCERFQGLIRKMVLLQIDSTQENLVIASAKCYILLSKATERSFKPPPTKPTYTGWTYNEVLLCNNLHAIMDELFSDLIQLESPKLDIQDQLELPFISDKNLIQYYNAQRQRFSNLCIYLSSMLRGYQAKNSVFPHEILRILCRGLAIKPLSLKNKTSIKEQMLYIILPKLHISLLTVLDAFINGFAQELIPLGTTILQLFQQMLQWTSTILENQITFSNSKPFRNVRVCIYKCLCSWLINTGSLSGIETIANECVASMLKDITPERGRILLTTQQKTQHLSKRAIKRFKHSQYENSPILNNEECSTKSGCLDADLCKEALVTLQNIFFSGSILLKPIFYKNVQNTVISLLYNLYLGSSEQDFYNNHNECRLELFKVLKALQINPHTALTFPIQYCLEISHMAAHDIDLRIVQEAKLASAELEKIVHPVAPTLQLPRQEKPDDEFVLESQTEEIVITSKSDKRNKTEEELLQDTDVIPSVHKRPKLTTSECVQITENGNSTELIELREANNSIINENLCENIEEKESENISQERDEMHSKEQNQTIDGITNVIIESRTECELSVHVNLEEQKQCEQSKDLVSCASRADETVEESPPEITEEVQKEMLEDNPEEWEEMDVDVLNSLHRFSDDIKLNK